MVITASTGRSASVSAVARASAAPWSGLVPAISSSSSTSAEPATEAFKISATFARCPENVDRSPSTDCRSPMSARTASKKPIRLPGAAATSSPARAISAASPTVFMSTVLPPAFGPLTIRTAAAAPPSATSLATTAPVAPDAA